MSERLSEVRRRGQLGEDLIRKIYGNRLELDGWQKILRQTKSPTASDQIRILKGKLLESLIDYLITRRDEEIPQGRVEMIRFSRPNFSERIHSFSQNQVIFLFPVPAGIERGATFSEETTLDSIRRKGDSGQNSVGDSLAARQLLGRHHIIPESLEGFISRTIAESQVVERTRRQLQKEDPKDPIVRHLLSLDEYLIMGRLLGLCTGLWNEGRSVPGLTMRVDPVRGHFVTTIKWKPSLPIIRSFPAESRGRIPETQTALSAARLI